MKYEIGFQKSLYQFIIVEADSEGEAVDKAREKLGSNWGDWNNDAKVCDIQKLNIHYPIHQ